MMPKHIRLWLFIALRIAAPHSITAFTGDGVEPVGQIHHKVANVSRWRRGLRLGLRDIELGVGWRRV